MDLDELETMSRLGDKESVRDDESVVEDDDSEKEEASAMPPPAGIPKKRKQCGGCDEKKTVNQWSKEKFKGPLCRKCHNLRLVRLPWVSPTDLVILLEDPDKKTWWIGLIRANDCLEEMATPTTKETVNKRITNRLQITGGGETFILSEACKKKIPAQELAKCRCTFMGKTYYGLSGKLEKTPAFLHILPQTLIDIEHCFALDDGQVTTEKCQQKELFQHFSKLEKVAGREPPERNMQELLDAVGLTWADVPAHLMAQGVDGARAVPVAWPGAPGSAGVRASAPGSAGVRVSAASSSGGGAPGVQREGEGEEDPSEDDEEEEEDEESNGAETGDEAGGGRLGNAFEDADLQEGGRSGRGGRRGRGRGRGRGQVSGIGRRLPAAPGRPLALSPGSGSRQRGASRGGCDARTAKAQGIVQASREQCKSLSQENWSQLVTEGSVNGMRKELVHYRDLFQNVDSEVTSDLQFFFDVYEALCPFMSVWRLHKGLLPEEVLVAQLDNLNKISNAVSEVAGGDGWAPGLAYIHEQAKFWSKLQAGDGIEEAIDGLELTAFEQTVRRQASFFKEGMSSEEVVTVTSYNFACGVQCLVFAGGRIAKGVGECGVRVFLV